MRRALLAVALVLTACSQAPEEPEETPLTVEVDGQLGKPTVSTVHGDLPDEQTVIVETEGAGRELTADSPVLYTVSSFDDDRRLLAGGEGPILTTAAEAPIDVIGVTEGSRLLTINPQEGGAEILVYDILDTVVQGEPRDVSGPFTVTENEDGVPVLGGKGEVSSLSTQVVIRGSGPQASVDDEIYVQYSISRADDGELLDSTWESGPILLQLDETYEGLRTGVTELPIGSRVLLTIPAGQAQGTDDVVVIIDLLALG